jgi:hypothetical protein
MEAAIRDALGPAACSPTPRKFLQGQVLWLAQSLDTAKIRAALTAASRHVTVGADVFDTHGWLLPCANGLTYDLRTGELRASRREDLMTRCVPVCASREPIPHPRWDAMLRLVMHDDPELVRYLRHCLGLLLTGDVSEKCFWFWVGETNRGKTTVLEVLAAHPGALASPPAFAVPDERRRVLVPPSHRLFQPRDELVGRLGMLARQRAAVQDALEGLRHIEPGAGQGCIERQDAVLE